MGIWLLIGFFASLWFLYEAFSWKERLFGYFKFDPSDFLILIAALILIVVWPMAIIGALYFKFLES